MIDYERGLYVRIKELQNGPNPRPSSSGFSADVAYRVIGIYNPSESGECWLILVNDDDQMWYISQRHVRAHSINAGTTQFRIAADRKAPDLEVVHSVQLQSASV